MGSWQSGKNAAFILPRRAVFFPSFPSKSLGTAPEGPLWGAVPIADFHERTQTLTMRTHPIRVSLESE